MMGQYIDEQGIVFTAVMLNDGEFTIYKERLRLGQTEELLATWTVPESVALAIADLFEREEESRLVAIATEQPAEQVNRPIDDYHDEINSDAYIAYLNSN